MSKEQVIEQAEKLIKAGKFDKAIKEYQKLVDEDPANMRAKLKVGDLYAKKKDIPLAIKTYREVADNYSQENFHLKAIAVYKTILKLSPTLIEINEKLGDLYHQVGLDSDAVNQYYIVSTAYDSKGMVKEALEIRKKIVQIDSANIMSRIRLAELMQADGQTEESMQEYQKIAEILVAKKDRDGLIEIYEKMLYFRPADVDMMIKLCKIYFEKREFKKALKKIDSSSPEIKKRLDISELWAEALLEDRQVDAARRKFKDIYSTSLEEKETERAARIYSRILQEFSDDQDYLNDLEEIRRNAGVSHASSQPKFRQDFEKTEVIDLSKMDEMLKKK